MGGGGAGEGADGRFFYLFLGIRVLIKQSSLCLPEYIMVHQCGHTTISILSLINKILLFNKISPVEII